MALSKFLRKKLPTPEIGSAPHQPLSFKYPKREFGKKVIVKRSFQSQWFSRWSWLHYNEEKDAAYYFNCVKAYKEGKLQSVGCVESTYISKGYNNWKDAAVKFSAHEDSACYKTAILKTITIPSTHADIGESLSSQHAQEKLERQKCFLKLLSNVRFLARQALPLQGDGDESDSNYIQLLKLHGEDDPRVFEWLKKKTDKYTSADTQNEMLKVMSLQVLRGDSCKFAQYRLL